MHLKMIIHNFQVGLDGSVKTQHDKVGYIFNTHLQAFPGEFNENSASVYENLNCDIISFAVTMHLYSELASQA